MRTAREQGRLVCQAQHRYSGPKRHSWNTWKGTLKPVMMGFCFVFSIIKGKKMVKSDRLMIMVQKVS